MNTTELVVEIRPEKNSGPYGIWTLDLWKYMKIIYVHCGEESNVGSNIMTSS